MIRAPFHRTVAWIVSALLLSVGAPLAAEEAKPDRPARAKAARPDGKRKEGKRAPAEAEAVVKAALPPELTNHMPVGREFLGVSIPSYEGDKLKSVMTADSVIRVDEKFLDLLNLVVKVHNAEGKPETTISMDEAAYNLEVGELASKTPSTIEQPRFTMTGDQMIYLTNSQVARLVGNVRLVVPDAGNIAPAFGLPDTPTTAAPPAAPGATSPPPSPAATAPPAAAAATP